MGFLLNGVNTGGLPEYLIRPLIEQHEIKYFVETGTAGGNSARLAATMFEKVYTIEVIEGRPEMKNAPDNIDFFVGDSAELLPDLIRELNRIKGSATRQFVFFWLDAHYSGDTVNTSGYPECPLLAEIEAVAEYGEDAIIFIDDARLFFGHPPHPNNPKEWPSIQEVFALLTKKFPYNHITITDDYIICVPIHVREVLDAEWRERFNLRYPSAQDKLKSQVKDVYEAFKNYVC